MLIPCERVAAVKMHESPVPYLKQASGVQAHSELERCMWLERSQSVYDVYVSIDPQSSASV